MRPPLPMRSGLLGDAPIGLLGFCMGGMYAMKSLALGRFDSAVAFYGMVRVPEHWRAPANATPSTP